MIQIAICDDEINSREYMKRLLLQQKLLIKNIMKQRFVLVDVENSFDGNLKWKKVLFFHLQRNPK